MANHVRIGDTICLFCEDTQGYVHSSQTSSTCDGLFSFTNQDKEQPTGIPNVHAVMFQICTQNRYKLTKKYRNLVKQHGENPEAEDLKRLIKEAKDASEVEELDNTSEQVRLLAKDLKYGDKVQLLHVFTNKYVHISTDDTSVVDKSKMLVTLQKHSSKNAQFMIMPRYKIKNPGDPLEMYDQIVLESVKSPGNYIHASDPYQVDSFTHGSEMNAGVDKTGFTVMIFNRSHSQTGNERFLKGGDVIRLFHMDIEAYLVAEGTWGRPPAENVHLRIREANPKEPRTLYRPKSGITYWQIENATSIINGHVIRWEDSVRFRHMTTRCYLAVSDEYDIYLTENGLDPSTVFRLHSLSQDTTPDPEHSQVMIDKNGRIEHVVTGCWVYAPVDLTYIKNLGIKKGEDGADLEKLQWDGADLLQVSASPSRQYRDAFTLQKVAEQEWRSFNYVAGMIPFIKDLIEKRKDPEFLLTSRQTASIIMTLKDLRSFLTQANRRPKDRQKLLRNLRAVDVMVDLLRIPIDDERKDAPHMYEVSREMYKVLHTYTIGNSRKNALYAATYIPFFMTQLSAKGQVGLECCKMLVDLMRGNRRIVDRITPEYIKTIISMLHTRKNYLYLELLCVLCYCDGIAMTENQTLIAEDLLEKQKETMIHIELGQDISLIKDILYVSCDNRETFIPLHTFCYKSNPNYDDLKYLFLLQQLELFKKLCAGRNQAAINVLTRNREFFTWEVAYTGLKSEVVPFRMRAKFCELIVGLFIDVGDNFSIIAVTSNNFVYDEIDVHNYGQSAADAVPHDFDRNFPSMRVWIMEFFKENKCLISSQPARNELIKEVLRMVANLILYGYLGSREDMDEIMRPVSNLINGAKDLPFSPGKGTEFTSEEKTMVKTWRREDRYKPGEETDAIIKAKLQGLEMIEILLIKEFNRRVRFFVSTFKKLEIGVKRSKARKPLSRLLHESFNEKLLWTDSKMRKKIEKFFLEMNERTKLLDPLLPVILFDLTKYPSDALNTKALSILNKFHMANRKLFETTARTHALMAMESVRVHREALNNMVLLTQLSKSKLTTTMANEVVRILHTFAELCHVPHFPDRPHYIGQDILVNNGLLDLLLPLVTQEVDKRLQDRFVISEKVVGGCLLVLRFLALENGYVQTVLMDQLDKLLSVQCCGELQALALQEIFRGHTVHCLRLQPLHIQKIVKLAGQYKEEAPEFLNLLKIIMKMEKSGTLLKRNQHLVTKYVMENYKSAAYPMNLPQHKRLKMLIGREGQAHQKYLTALIELLATCSEGENRYIESLCQTLISVPELLSILSNRNVAMLSKIGCARYFVYAYLRTARTPVESGVDELSHDSKMWKHIQIIWTLLTKVNKARDANRLLTQNQGSRISVSSTGRNGSFSNSRTSTPRTPEASETFRASLLTSTPGNIDGPEVDVKAIGKYMLTAGFLLIETFFSRFYTDDKELYPEEHEILKRLASAVVLFTESASDLAETQEELKNMIACVETVVASLQVTQSTLDKVCAETNISSTLINMKERLEKEEIPSYNREELAVNAMMHRFGTHLAKYLEGKNTLRFQISFNGRGSSEPYVPSELEVKIPLGEEFQKHMRSFNPLHRDENRCKRLIDHLEIAAKNVQNSRFVPEEELDLRCLQILRTVIYNQVMRLPDGWENKPQKHEGVLHVIRHVQGIFLSHNIIRKIGALLGRRTEIAMEVLSLYDLLLFNANRECQEQLLRYFKDTAEEVFFIFIRTRLHVAKMALKERRSIKAQNVAKKNEAQRKLQGLDTDDNNTSQVNQKKRKKFGFDKRALKKKSMAPFFRRKMANRLLVYEDETDGSTEKLDLGLVNHGFQEEEDAAEEVTTIGNYQDGSDVVLVFRVLAGMCDGQYRYLQDYLRIQPDNLCKVNMVAESTQFLATLYTHVDGETIDLTSQVFSALQEIAENNQENRVVVMNNKIVDYMNFLLRMQTFEGCDATQVVELKSCLMALIQSMTEENGPGCTQLAQEICDTIDKRALKRHVYMAYKVIVEGDSDITNIFCGRKDENSSNKKISKSTKDIVSNMGFLGTLILARFYDLDSSVEKQGSNFSLGFDNLEEKRAFYYFRSQVQSVEIVKSDNLQRIYFRVKNTDLLREEVREEAKWNIDRTSPSNKLRDLLSWSKDIIKDIGYQEKILKNPLLKHLAKRWAIWNYACILLSMVINVMMLWTWEAPAAINNLPENATSLTHKFTTYEPTIHWADYYVALTVLGALHNFCSLMLFISYLLLQHPRMPDFSFVKQCAKRFRKKEDDFEHDDEEEIVEIPSRLQASLLSAATVYYVLLMTLSFAGSFFYGYFFAFHLINIIANNELLKGVIKAVTQNGRSLIWVGIMGLIIIYLYALVAFAFMRAIFNEDDELYCNHLYECFVTVLRYGVIGDITDKFVMHPLSKNFQIFGFMTLYQLTFFILFTTIGLNVIFGIIVDTFSELRDMKWTAEKDMRDVCFICSRDSYDFEHEGLGFTHHVNYEHNMWAYIFYFCYLKSIKENDCRSIDLYVLKMLNKDKLDFFPINRALCLTTADDEDETDNKLDDVVATLRDIRVKQQQEEENRRREAERRRQELWQDQYRRSAEGRPATSASTMGLDDGGSVADESTA